MKIGKLKLQNRLFLAPMLEPNDIAFRLLCKKAGCTLTYTGMISPLSKKSFSIDDHPAVQLFGNSGKSIRDFISNHQSSSLWDFNLGCPSKLSRKLEHGAFMHEDVNKIKRIVRIMKESTEKPVTIKLRKSPNAIKILKSVVDKIDAVGIHPRTFSQGYSGLPDYDFALKLKEESPVPVIYSGNVDEKNAKEILKEFDYVFIGRSAVGDPGIFSRILGKKNSIEFSDYIKLAEKYDLPFRQIKFQAMNFTKGMENAKALRRKIILTKTVDEVERVIL